MKKILFSFSLLMIAISNAMAVSYSMSSGTQTVNCALSNSFFDDGGQLSDYSNSASITETFTSSSGLSLKFKFTSFSTQQGNDVLTIYDGSSTSSPIIGQFSGSNSPGIVISSTSSLTFVFSSNSANTSSGWTASITCVASATAYTMANNTTISACDAIFYDPGGTSNYGANLTYVETFTSSASGYCPTITFYTIDIGKFDTLTIYDGTSTSASQIRVFTQTSTTPTLSILSSSGSLTFRFRTNGSGSNTGWYAVLSCDPCPSSLTSTATYTMPTSGISGSYLGSNMVTTCGGTLTDDGGLSGNYSDNVSSIYRVFCPSTADNCMRVQFYSISFNNNDYLNITNSATQNGTSLSGNITNTSCSSYASCMGLGYGPYTSYDPSGCLSFRFTSNSSSNSSGFAATIDCVPCAGGPSGTDNTDCSNATPICGSSSFTAASLGPGLSSELGNSCLASENYSNWYSIKFSHGGTMGLTVAAVTSSDDYDFALFGPGASCGSLSTPVRCSYGGVTSNGQTGMGNSATDTSEGASGNGWVKTLNVNTGDTYYLMISKWTPAGDGFTLSWNLTNGASLDCDILPVTLTSFNCLADDGIITLDWSTEAEVNNDHFVIERSSDGENYSLFSTVPGKGTTTLPSQYFIADYHPLPGNNYYRLTQVDKNGNQTILRTTTCTSPIENDEITLRIFDMSGKTIYESRIMLADLQYTLRTIDLPSGVYITALIHKNGRTDLSKYLRMQ